MGKRPEEGQDFVEDAGNPSATIKIPSTQNTVTTLDRSDREDLTSLQFPERLLALLDQRICPECLYWLKGCKKFAVVPVNFSVTVLDPFFDGTKFESFTRKLNRW